MYPAVSEHCAPPPPISLFQEITCTVTLALFGIQVQVWFGKV